MEIIKVLWYDNLLPSIIATVFGLTIVLIVMSLFTIKGSSIASNLRFKLLELPLVKGFLIFFGLNISGIKISWYTVAFVYMWGVCCFIWRWVTYEKFKTQVLLGDRDYYHIDDLNVIVSKLAVKLECKIPKVLIVKADYPSPFVLGFLNPFIVIPRYLIEELNNDEIEALLAHEMAHIARWDNLYIWQAVLFRDLMFFNPLVIYIYRLLVKEKEKNCDDLAISLTKKPNEFAGMLLKVHGKMKAALSINGPSVATIYQSLAGSRSLFSERVERILKLPEDYYVLTKRKWILYYCKLVVFIAVSIVIFSVNIY